MLDDLDAKLLPVVAHVTSERPNLTNWTELAIYRHENGFIAEIVGETRVEGQARRQRRKAFHTVAKALKWDAFDPSSKLYGELRDKAIAWMEAWAREVASVPAGMVGVASGGSTQAEPIEHGQPIQINPPSHDSFILQQNSAFSPRRFVCVRAGPWKLVGEAWTGTIQIVREIFGDDDA